MNYNIDCIEWHAVDASNLSMFISDYKQISLQGTTFDNLQNYTKNGYNLSRQDC